MYPRQKCGTPIISHYYNNFADTRMLEYLCGIMPGYLNIQRQIGKGWNFSKNNYIIFPEITSFNGFHMRLLNPFSNLPDSGLGFMA